MKCCENVLVTLNFPHGHCLDMELPAFLPVEKLERRLLETLGEMDPSHFGGAGGLSLQKQGQPLDGRTTLAQAGVWDGSILDAVLHQEV